MLVMEGVIEIDAKGNKTKAVGMVRELSHGVQMRATSLIVVGATKSLMAESGVILYTH